MNANDKIKNYIESRLESYGYTADQDKSIAYEVINKVVMVRLGYITVNSNEIPLAHLKLAKEMIDKIIPEISSRTIVDGYPYGSKLGIKSDWTISRNACGEPWLNKKLNQVRLTIMKNTKGQFRLDIYDPYLLRNKYDKGIILNSADWSSAANESDDIYRGFLTEIVKYALDQLQDLPEI